MDFECSNMTAFGCPTRDTAKNLMLQELIEGGTMTLDELCKRQCCIDCNNSCGYRCGRTYGKSVSEEFKKSNIEKVEYEQLSFI